MTYSNGGGSPHGAGRVRLENDSLAIAILPAAGGNISEITDRRNGRNWLWQNPHIPIGDTRTGGDYGLQLDSGGWDEILLSTSADRIDLDNEITHQVADHGELVRKRWSAEVCNDERGATLCEMSVAGESLDYEFRRVLRLHQTLPRFDIDYRLTNREDFPLPWYWCAHALFDARPNMRIELPDGLPFRVENAGRQSAGPHYWPFLDNGQQKALDLTNSFALNGATRRFARKVFAEAPDSGVVSIDVPDSSDCLTMRFDPKVLPWLGLWINNRGWSGCGSAPYLNLGLEPSTTPFDSVSEAIKNDAITWLQPGESREWSLSVELAT